MKSLHRTSRPAAFGRPYGSLRRLAGLWGLSFLLTGLMGCGAQSEPTQVPARPEERSSARSAAPAFSLPDLNGKTVSLADFKGDAVFLDFWATWCPPCRVSLPAIEKLFEDYASRNVRVVGISLDEDIDTVKRFVKRENIQYPILFGADSDVAFRYGVRGIPTTYLLDGGGNVVRRWVGYDPRLQNEWRQELDNLLR